MEEGNKKSAARRLVGAGLCPASEAPAILLDYQR
jgi:hypothetical protein